jgi:RND family efflux transporter MFP subunit
MFRKIILPIISIIGILFAIFMVFYGLIEPEKPPVLFDPPESPYEHFVAAEGLVESFGENVNLSVPFPELITDVYIKAGQCVKMGDPLFRVDTRQFEAELKTAQNQLKESQIVLRDFEKQLTYFNRLKDRSAVSEQEYTKILYATKKAREQIEVDKARVNEVKVRISRATVHAPFDGQIIEENIRIGAYANVNPFDRKTLIVFGKTKQLQIRVNVAEEEAWRVYKDAPGMAYVRGNSDLKYSLKFKYIEPHIIPKQTLTGMDFERVDTRVLQVVYELENINNSIYVGQLLDVYLKARPNNANSTRRTENKEH